MYGSLTSGCLLHPHSVDSLNRSQNSKRVSCSGGALRVPSSTLLLDANCYSGLKDGRVTHVLGPGKPGHASRSIPASLRFPVFSRASFSVPFDVLDRNTLRAERYSGSGCRQLWRRCRGALDIGDLETHTAHVASIVAEPNFLLAKIWNASALYLQPALDMGLAWISPGKTFGTPTDSSAPESKVDTPTFRATNASDRGSLKSKGGGKLSIHCNGDSTTIELLFSITISANQLSVYGAISEWCEGLAHQISGHSSTGTGSPVAR